MRLLEIILFMFTIPLHGFGNTIAVTGKVKDLGTGEPLAGVVVTTKDRTTGTATDMAGNFALKVPSGTTLVFSYIGYTTLERKVEGSMSGLQVQMSVDRKELKEVTVETKASPVANTATSSMVQLTPAQISALPSAGGEKDMVAALQLMPGIKKGADGAAGMFVRGGTSDQNLVLLDGITVYNPSHAIGFFSVFNSDAVKDVKLWKGAFPASVGGRLSSVLDVTSRNGSMDRWKTELTAGSVSAKCMLEGPIVKNKVSMMVAVRRTHLDQLLALAKIDLPYYFYDVNARILARLSPKSTLSVSQFVGNDVVKLVQTGGEQAGSLSINFGSVLGNRVTAANWTYTNARFKNVLTAGFSNYHYDIDATIKESHFTLRSSISDFTMKSHATSQLSEQTAISYGAEYSMLWMRPNQSTVYGSLNEHIKQSDGQYFSIHLASVFALADVHFTKRFAANGGLRLSQSFSSGFVHVVPEPRLNLLFKATKTINLKASYNRMSQHLYLVSSSSALLPTDLWYPVSKTIRPQTSHQYSLTVEKQLEGYQLTLDGYYKQMNDLVEYKEGTQLLLNDDIEKDLVQGRGRSYGFESTLQKTSGKMTGWVGYTLSWSQRQFDALNNGEYYFTRYDRRHDVSVAGSYEINKRFLIGAVYVWATGSRVTPVVGQFLMPSGSYNDVLTLPVYGKRNSLILSPTHRLDLNVVIKSNPKRKYQSELQVGAYNVYNQTQPYRLKVQPDGKGNLVYRQVGLFGFIPSISYNIKF